MDKMVNEFNFADENIMSNIEEVIEENKDVEYAIKHILRITVNNVNKGDSISIRACDLPIKLSACDSEGWFSLLECIRNINFTHTLVSEHDRSKSIAHNSSVYTGISVKDGLITIRINKHMNWDKFKELPEVIKIVCG